MEGAVIEGAIIEGDVIESDVIESQPAEGATQPPDPAEAAPPVDASARRGEFAPVRFASFERVSAPTFADGLHAFWSGDLSSAGRALDAEAQAEAGNPLALYYLALTHREAGRLDAADVTLSAAVAREAFYPISGWGAMMERVQGANRLWLEAARGAAGVGR